ncbi:hypothetical protein LOC54_02500 [Acetobacter sp. AN02]|uniref:hypothetical protein n=1 Tax=Acetobacter sp. AN02 TaxID=2894186 RepID=UPI00243414F5|nr:hypothetical protein [Acetobacter sp. AN02]MDG6093993.1 hypothetical protein [Acetobacter sp. AN02]
MPFSISARQGARSLTALGSCLLSGTVLMAHPARADDETDSLEVMERQIAHIQEEQAKLTKALVGMQKQLAVRRAKAASGHHGDALTPSHRRQIEARTRSHGEEPELMTADAEPGTPGHRVSSEPEPEPSFRDVPEKDLVIGHRAEDIIAHMAENQVGPHARETVGAQLSGAVGDHGVFHLGPVTIALGGFIDASAVYQNRQTATGTFNYWSALPLKNSPHYHTHSFEGGARYSRISLMARGNIDKVSTVSGFFEMDFGAGAATTDAYESNSYAFRLRQAYMAYDNSELNFHFLAGQAWSMLTPNRIGITPRQESLPETIESSMLAGQTWARQWQIRMVKDFFKHRLWLGLSIENPQTLYDTTGFSTYNGNDGQFVLPGGRVATIGKDGTGLTNNALFSSEAAPDVIGKIAWDPKWGHYELEGILHFPHDRVSWTGGGNSHTVVAGGGGGSAVLPLVPHLLEMRLAGLVGTGIGRYGSVMLPDAAIGRNGQPVPVLSVQATAGLIAHPTSAFDVYGYFGTQRAGRRYFSQNGSDYGYGNPMYNNTGCNIELSSLPCAANTRAVTEATAGAWWRFLKGKYGTAEVGVQLAWSRRDTWEAVGGHPSADVSQLFLDFRYLPFQ